MPGSGAERRWPLRLKRATSTRSVWVLTASTPVVPWAPMLQRAALTM